MIIKIWCTPGGHSVDTIMDQADPLRCPVEWTREEADVISFPSGPNDPWSPGIWYAKKGTGVWVLCCPEHGLVQPNTK